MQTPQLQISADNRTVKVSGALTFFTVAALWQQSQSLFKKAATELQFDLQQVTQSDSAGVALLLAWVRTARAQQKKIIFSSLPSQMLAIVKVSGLEHIL